MNARVDMNINQAELAIAVEKTCRRPRSDPLSRSRRRQLALG